MNSDRQPASQDDLDRCAGTGRCDLQPDRDKAPACAVLSGPTNPVTDCVPVDTCLLCESHSGETAPTKLRDKLTNFLGVVLPTMAGTWHG